MVYQIAARSEIYAAGGYYDDYPFSDLEDVASSQVQCLGTVFSSSRYNRGMPEIWSQDRTIKTSVLDLCGIIDAVHQVCPSSVALQIQDAIIFDNVIYLNKNGGCAPLYTTFRANDRPYVKPLDHNATPRALVFPGKRIFYLGSVGSFNYGHWLVDDLARLKFLNDNPDRWVVVVPSYHGMDAIRLESIKAFLKKINTEIIFVSPDEPIICDQLTYVTPVSFHPYLKNVNALNYLRSFAQPKPIWRRRSSKIYVTRRKDRGRTIVNSEEIERFFTQNGFAIFDPEDFSFSEQMRTFARAEIVAGTMCAAMCNCIFMPPGGRMICLAPEGWLEPFYWDLASVSGLQYKAVYGPRSQLYELPQFDNFRIPVSAIHHLLP